VVVSPFPLVATLANRRTYSTIQADAPPP